MWTKQGTSSFLGRYVVALPHLLASSCFSIFEVLAYEIVLTHGASSAWASEAEAMIRRLEVP
jgi:hypothetical protein